MPNGTYETSGMVPEPDPLQEPVNIRDLNHYFRKGPELERKLIWRQDLNLKKKPELIQVHKGTQPERFQP
jgi:hypothetical protein